MKRRAAKSGTAGKIPGRSRNDLRKHLARSEGIANGLLRVELLLHLGKLTPDEAAMEAAEWFGSLDRSDRRFLLALLEERSNELRKSLFPQPPPRRGRPVDPERRRRLENAVGAVLELVAGGEAEKRAKHVVAAKYDTSIHTMAREVTKRREGIALRARRIADELGDDRIRDRVIKHLSQNKSLDTLLQILDTEMSSH